MQEKRIDAIIQVADKLAHHLSHLTPVREGDIQHMGRRALEDAGLGGEMSPDECWRAVEVALFTYAITEMQGPADRLLRAPQSSSKLARMLSHLREVRAMAPTFTHWTDTQLDEGQVCTPPHYAALCAWLLCLEAGDTVLEPSAGLGALAVWPLLLGANVTVNETDGDLHDVLSTLAAWLNDGQGGGSTGKLELLASYQATSIPGSMRAERVLLAPPMRLAGSHLMSAVEHVKPGGRLVAILPDHPHPEDYEQLCRRFQVRAMLDIAGEEHYGTHASLNTTLLVLDHSGPTLTLPVTNPEGEPRVSLAQASVLLEEVARRLGRDMPKPALDTRENLLRRALAHLGAPVAEALEEALTEELPDEELGAVFQPYQPFLRHREAQPHPDPLVESDTMKLVRPPVPRGVQLTLPRAAIERGHISEVQLETVLYAVHASNQVLADGTRKAYLVGHGTGVGKGVILAAIAQHFWLQGARRILYVTKDTSLLTAARRDWKAVGGLPQEVFLQEGPKEAYRRRQGVMFTTYKRVSLRDLTKDEEERGGREQGGPAFEYDAAGQISGMRKRRKKKFTGVDRWQQIVDWNPEVILYDEAHMMGNATSVKGKRGASRPSQRALQGIALLRALPQARVFFASATAATEIQNLAYAAERLGLCGPDVASFPTLDAFVNKVGAGGMLAMEMVAKDMKAMGVYNAATLSYNDITFELLEHKLTPAQRLMYDAATAAWRIVLDNMYTAMRLTLGNNSRDAMKTMHGQFYGAMQRFFNQMLTSMKTPATIAHIEAALARGECAVIQLVNTTEAATERAVAAAAEEGLSLDELDITPRDTLQMLVENCFPVHLYRMVSNGRTMEARLVRGPDGEPVEDDQAVAMRQKLLDQIGHLSVPQGALDMILDHFGTGRVAEITGRKARYVLDEEGHRVREPRSKERCDAEAEQFMDDRRPILIFSGAGNTGRSFHSDRRAKNQRRRNHYVLQAGWRADEALQGLGRTHRTNQVNAPHYVLVTTDLKGEKRFVTSVARRIEQLGSLTRGNRKAATGGLFSADDNLESAFATGAIYTFMKALEEGRLEQTAVGDDGEVHQLGLSLKELCELMGLRSTLDVNGNIIRKEVPHITRFLNRMLCLPCAQQDAVFAHWYSMMQAAVEEARENGTLERGVEKISADGIDKVLDVEVYRDPKTNAVTRMVELELRHRNILLSFDQVLGGQYLTDTQVGVGQNAGVFSHWACNRESGRVYALFRASQTMLSNGSVVQSYRRVGTGGFTRVNEVQLARMSDYRISEEEARAKWDKELAAADAYDTENMYLVTGALIPVWDLIAGVEQRIVSAETDAGERLIGRVVKQEYFPETMQNLGAVDEGVYLDAEQLQAAIMDQDNTVYLAGGGSLRRSRMVGTPKLVVLGLSENGYKGLRDLGLVEEHYLGNGNYLYWVPDTERLEKVVAIRRPVEMRNRQGDLVSNLRAEPADRQALSGVDEEGPAFVDITPMVELVTLPDELARFGSAPRAVDTLTAPDPETLPVAEVAAPVAEVAAPVAEVAAPEAPAPPVPSSRITDIAELVRRAKAQGKRTDRSYYEREKGGQLGLF